MKFGDVRVHQHVGVQMHSEVTNRINWFHGESADRQQFVGEAGAGWDAPRKPRLVGIQLQMI